MVDQERQELYKTIWSLANKLRGSVDGWDFKNYILGFLFYRYISEDFENYIQRESNSKKENFKYSELDDNHEWIQDIKEDFIERKGYFIYPSHLFSRMLQKSQSDWKNLNEDINNAFKKIEDSTMNSDSKSDFAGLFKLMDFSDVKLGNEVIERNTKIKKILEEISKMNLRTNESDMFGDAYEYLIGMYASNAGKSGGEFYTPPEVSELLVSLVTKRGSNKKIKSVYDPTCGSGSLLLKFLKTFPDNKDLEFFGQEINFTTYNLCRMNMFLHNIGYERFEIKCGDTLKQDKFEGKKFDAVVSNPPYSISWESKEMEDDIRFFSYGALAPNDNADWAFVQHSLHHLENDGVAAIVCYPGIFYRDNIRERKIREFLVCQNYIDAIIQLPKNLFYGTAIATYVLVLRKSKQEPNILFINAENCFKKAKNRNQLKKEEIIDVYINYQEKENYSRIVSNREIEKENYDLSIGKYIEEDLQEEKMDINKLNDSIKEKRKKINFMLDEIDNLTKMFS